MTSFQEHIIFNKLIHENLDSIKQLVQNTLIWDQHICYVFN